MTRRHHVIARIVLAAAAIASAATSPIARDWQLTADAPAFAAAVDDATPHLDRSFRAELRGFGGQHVDGGLLTAHVVLRARPTGAGTATGRLVLQSTGRPPETVGYALARGETQTFDLDLAVFGDCTADPCLADAALAIERDFQLDDPAIDTTVSGSIDATGVGDQPLAATLRLDVVPGTR
jgi:hypothetical protein